tara:strand:+ start:153 stop:320 length:168 start_codon:yes stop_codon:yes gene_type:complete
LKHILDKKIKNLNKPGQFIYTIEKRLVMKIAYLQEMLAKWAILKKIILKKYQRNA